MLPRALASRALLREAAAGLGAFFAATLAATFGHAQEGFVDQPVEIHAFVSQGAIKSTANNYLAESERGSLEFTEVGVNLTKQLTDELRVGVQLFARDLGPRGNYAPQFDWYYLDYRFFDWLGLRLGRSKIPFGLYNDSSDVDAARVPILLPQSIYPVQNRDYLLAQTGAELHGYVPLGSGGDLEYRAYGGTIFLDQGSDATIESVEVPYVVGGRLMWLTPLTGLQVGGTIQRLRIDLDYRAPPEVLDPLIMAGVLPPTSDGRVQARLPALLWVASAEYVKNELTLASEYSRWHVDLESSEPALIPEAQLVSERAYVLGSYRLTPWFVPGLYYALHFPDTADRTGRDAYQHDVAATLRFDVNEHWLLKAEGHLMVGTAGLRSDLNDGRPLAELERTWGVFLLKATAYF